MNGSLPVTWPYSVSSQLQLLRFMYVTRADNNIGYKNIHTHIALMPSRRPQNGSWNIGDYCSLTPPSAKSMSEQPTASHTAGWIWKKINDTTLPTVVTVQILSDNSTEIYCMWFSKIKILHNCHLQINLSIDPEYFAPVRIKIKMEMEHWTCITHAKALYLKKEKKKDILLRSACCAPPNSRGDRKLWQWQWLSIKW